MRPVRRPRRCLRYDCRSTSRFPRLARPPAPPAWRVERLRAVAHEYVHVVQLERAGLAVADQTLSGPVNESPSAGPFWLIEGAAEVVSWLVLQKLGLGSYPESLFDYAADASGGDARLVELESFIGYRAAGRRFRVQQL